MNRGDVRRATDLLNVWAVSMLVGRYEIDGDTGGRSATRCVGRYKVRGIDNAVTDKGLVRRRGASLHWPTPRDSGLFNLDKKRVTCPLS